MTFTLRDTRLANVDAIVLENGASGELVQILPTLGATVQRLRLDTGSGAKDVLVADSEAELAANPLFRGRLLCPFNDRIAHGRYRFAGHEHQLVSNSTDDDSAIHGLVFDQGFEVLERHASEGGARLSLGYALEPEAFAGYPFALRLTLDYALTARGFRCDLTLLNQGSTRAPLTFGWHPYFRLSDKLEDHRLLLAAEQFVEVDQQLFPTGNVASVANSAFDFRRATSLGTRPLDVALVAPKNGSTLLSAGNERLTLTQATDFFKYVQLFIPPDRASIAIEPVSAATDAFNRPELGLAILEPGAELKSWFAVSGAKAP